MQRHNQAFHITDHVEFNKRGRAQCPACAQLGKDKSKLNLSLIPGTDGAYKCHRGCTPQEIRDALGKPKPAQVPSNIAKPKTANTLTPEKVRDQHEQLLKGNKALPWLLNRGIPQEAIEHFQLGIGRTKVDEAFKYCISIPLPTEEPNSYYQKKRIQPWDPTYTGKPWSQHGIPAMTFFTHHPTKAKTLWLCEGEWDAIWLGWLMREQEQIAVATFTCGADTIPTTVNRDLADFSEIITFYDLDQAGTDGAVKLGKKLGKERLKAAVVPHPEKPKEKWDVSDALKAGFTLEDFDKAARYAKFPQEQKANPIRDRMVSNRDLIENAPEYTDWLVPDLLTANELFLLAAPPRAGKSLLAMALAYAVATGTKFLDRPCTQGKVLYINLEDSDTKIKERETAQGWDEDLPVYWVDRFKLDEWSDLADLVEEQDIRLFIIDTLSRAKNTDVAENSAEMSQLLEPFQTLCRDKGVTGLLIHHTGKVPEGGKVDPFETIRGSSAIRATCRGTWILAPEERNYRLCVENGWGKHDLKIRLDNDTLFWTLLGKWTPENVNLTQSDQVLDHLNKVGKATVDELHKVTNIPKASLYKVLTRLQGQEMVDKGRTGKITFYSRIGIRQIRQLENLSNFCNDDAVRVRGQIRQDPKTHLDPQKSDHFEKSDQKNDHFSDLGDSGQDVRLSNKSLESLPEEEYRNLTNSRQELDNTPQSDQKSDQADPSEPIGPIPVDPNEELEEW